MNNQQIINHRWKKTERAFRSHLREVREVYRSIGDDSIDLIRSLNIRYEDLNRNVPAKVKRQVNRKIESWKKEGLLKDYFGYLVSKLKYTYSGVLEVLIYGLYMSGSRKINDISKEIFMETAEDTYSQGLQDLNRKGKPLTWAMILPFLMIPGMNLTYEQYVTVINETGSDEMYRQILESLRQQLDKLEEKVNDLARKQSNRILNVNGDKESGTLVDTAIGIGNDAYILAGGEKDQLILFVAEMDERTTDMCRSLDHQIFHTKDWNTFTRYSDYYKGKHTFKWFGLERGLNMPPINDHFHWCRSTLTYNLNINTMEDMKKGYIDITQEWLSDQKERKAIGENRDHVIGADGKLYRRGEKGVDITFEPKKEDRDSAEWWMKIKGGNINLNPRVNHPSGVQTADLEIDGKQVEVKTMNGSGKWTVFNLFNKGEQARIYLINCHDSSLSREEIFKQFDALFNYGSRHWVDEVILRDGEELVKVYRRIK